MLLDWASMLFMSQNSRFRAQGERQTGRASDVADQLLFSEFGDSELQEVVVFACFFGFLLNVPSF